MPHWTHSRRLFTPAIAPVEIAILRFIESTNSEDIVTIYGHRWQGLRHNWQEALHATGL